MMSRLLHEGLLSRDRRFWNRVLLVQCNLDIMSYSSILAEFASAFARAMQFTYGYQANKVHLFLL